MQRASNVMYDACVPSRSANNESPDLEARAIGRFGVVRIYLGFEHVRKFASIPVIRCSRDVWMFQINCVFFFPFREQVHLGLKGICVTPVSNEPRKVRVEFAVIPSSTLPPSSLFKCEKDLQIVSGYHEVSTLCFLSAKLTQSWP